MTGVVKPHGNVLVLVIARLAGAALGAASQIPTLGSYHGGAIWDEMTSTLVAGRCLT